MAATAGASAGAAGRIKTASFRHGVLQMSLGGRVSRPHERRRDGPKAGAPARDGLPRMPDLEPNEAGVTFGANGPRDGACGPLDQRGPPPDWGTWPSGRDRDGPGKVAARQGHGVAGIVRREGESLGRSAVRAIQLDRRGDVAASSANQRGKGGRGAAGSGAMTSR